jgi:outer membrane protein insertion porin family/translocation and assembly module TamA
MCYVTTPVSAFLSRSRRGLRRLCPLLTTLAICAAVAGCREDQTVAVHSLKFTGIHSVKESDLRAALATTASSRLPWGAKHYFTRQQFEADLKRIVAFYRDRGFPDARVKSFDVKLNKQQDEADISVNIEEGQPVLVQDIEFNGFERIVPPRHFNALKQRLPLKTGEPLDRALAQATREMVLDELKDHGYPYATVKLTDRAGSSDKSRILTLDTVPGTLARYGPIEITGNATVSDKVVRRQLTYRPGQRYRLSQIEESQRKLYELEIFQFANIVPDVPEGQQPAVVPTKLTLTEGKPRKVNFGIGYGSEEKARASVDWRHVNFFGGARTMQWQGQWSSLDRGVRATFKQPAFPKPRYGLTASAQLWHNEEPSYSLDTDGGSITIERPLAKSGPSSQRNATTTLLVTYTNQFEKYRISNDALADLSFRDELIALGLNPCVDAAGQSAEGQGRPCGEGKGLMSSVGFDVRRSTAENQVSARTGYMAALHLEHAGKFLQGDFNYFETTLEGRYYLALGRRSAIALRVRGGSINGYGPELQNVPFFKRYFLGGANSLRGWGRFEVAPQSGSGLPIGGHTQFESSAELRAPVWGNLSAVAFVDAGNVWTGAWDFGSLKYDAGPGLRYNTPIGPIRVDLGFQLNPYDNLLVNGKPESRHFRVHFSIGQAF